MEAKEDSLGVRRIYEIDGIRVFGESLVKQIGKIVVKEISTNRVNTEVAIGNMIKDMPGVFLTERGKGESVVRFRGFEDRHIRVFIDGMPISNGYFGNYDLHLISANNVSQIHLIKGPVSHQYGFNTMGGALNIITDKLKEENVLNTRFLYSSHGKTQASFNGSYALGRSQVYMSSSYLYSPDFILPQKLDSVADGGIEDGGERRINSSREQYSMNIRYITDIAAMHTITFASGYSYMPYKENPPSIYEHDDNRYSKLEDWGKISASFSLRSTLTDNLEITASSYYDQSEDTYISFLDAKYEKVDWKSLIRNNTLGFNTNAIHRKRGYFTNDLGFRCELKGYERTGGPGYENKWVDNYQTMTKIYHTFLYPDEAGTLSWTISNAISSYDHSLIGNLVWYWEPQTAMSYRYRDQTYSLAYGLSNQFPTMRELFSSTSGNPKLKPEKAHKVEVSHTAPLQLKYINGTIGSTLFYNRVDDLIDRDRYIYYNMKRMSTYGAEMNLNFSLINQILHDYDVSVIRLDKNNSSVNLMEYPEVKLRFTHHVKLSENLSASLSTQWYDKSLTYYREQDYYYLPSFTVHDFGLKYFYRNANLTLNMTNLLDTYYEPQYGYPSPGREITLAIEIQLF